MNIIIRIWLLITCLAFGIFFAQLKLVNDEFKERNPNVKMGGGTLKNKIEALLGMIMLCACPILHLFTIYTTLFCYEDIITRAVKKIEQDMDKRK